MGSLSWFLSWEKCATRPGQLLSAEYLHSVVELFCCFLWLRGNKQWSSGFLQSYLSPPLVLLNYLLVSRWVGLASHNSISSFPLFCFRSFFPFVHSILWWASCTVWWFRRVLTCWPKFDVKADGHMFDCHWECHTHVAPLVVIAVYPSLLTRCPFLCRVQWYCTYCVLWRVGTS